jgi:hypothetical protein
LAAALLFIGTRTKGTKGGRCLIAWPDWKGDLPDGVTLQAPANGTGDKWFDAEPRPESPETIRIIMKDGKIYKNTLN